MKKKIITPEDIIIKLKYVQERKRKKWSKNKLDSLLHEIQFIFYVYDAENAFKKYILIIFNNYSNILEVLMNKGLIYKPS